MPRWKAAVQAAETLEAVEKAAEAEKAGRECTYEVLARADVFEKPGVKSSATLILSRGERIIGTVSEIGGLPWLKLSSKTIDTHPLRDLFPQGGAWVLVADPSAALGTGRYLARAPAELGWRSACEAGERPEILEVVGAGGLPVIVDEESGDSPENFLVEVGSLIKVVKVDTERRCMAFELMTGDGPQCGWVSLESWGSASLRRASIDDVGAPARRRTPQAPPAQDAARCEEAMRLYASRLMKREEVHSGGIGHREVLLPWRCRLRAQERDEDEEAKTDAECEAQEDLARDLASSGTATKTPSSGSDDSEDEDESEDAEFPHGICRRCGLPLGQLGYMRPESEASDCAFPEYLHGECMAQSMLHTLQEEEKAAQEQERIRKQKRREEYGIGWSAGRIPLNAGPARALTGRVVPHGLCALAVARDNKVTVVPTVSPAAAVNLEYLSVALRVRKEEDREPLFSLDPVASHAGAMQVKRFEPYWLKGTSVGDVLFESDYHLKELSMGEHEQPVIGMKSCRDLEDVFTMPDWVGREWFVVRKADVMMAEDGVLVPVCKMGVEAREEVLREDGRMEDARVTKPDHPMVKYAEMFTHFFDLIAERKSVIYHLRELAKASILAKYLLMSSANLESLWFDLYETRDEPCILEIPQLWNEHNFSEISVRDGRIVDDAPGTIMGGVRAVYGGVQFGLNRFRMGPGGPAAAAVQSRLGVASSIAAKRGFLVPTRLGARGPLGIPRVAAVMAGPRGVDLGLGKFPLDQTQVSPHLGPLTISPDISGCASLGSAFWAELEGTSGSVFSSEQRDLLKRVFDPRLSDRRSEGELFQPPDVDFAYCNKLRCLLNEEDEVRRQRKAHFFSRQFDINAAGPLFPCWASSFRLQDGRQKAQQQPVGRLQARPDWVAQASQLRHLLQTPVFDRPTEDGLAFRIYRLGSLEVRTTQDVGGSEVVGAVFSRRSAQESAPSRRRAATELGSEQVAKVTEYVERDPARASRTACRYYVVMETEQGNRAVCELLQDGKVAWSEDPEDLNDRNSFARVVATEEQAVSCEGSGVLVSELKALSQAIRQAERRCSARARRAFAHELFALAASEVADERREKRSASVMTWREGEWSASSASSACEGPVETRPFDLGDV